MRPTPTVTPPALHCGLDVGVTAQHPGGLVGNDRTGPDFGDTLVVCVKASASVWTVTVGDGRRTVEVGGADLDQILGSGPAQKA
ncbi:MAG: hypothetical protein PVG83_10425 [Acidimicrobiia bacterium]